MSPDSLSNLLSLRLPCHSHILCSSNSKLNTIPRTHHVISCFYTQHCFHQIPCSHLFISLAKLTASFNIQLPWSIHNDAFHGSQSYRQLSLPPRHSYTLYLLIFCHFHNVLSLDLFHISPILMKDETVFFSTDLLCLLQSLAHTGLNKYLRRSYY